MLSKLAELPLLTLAVVLPIIFSPLAYALGEKLKANVGWIATAILFISTLFVFDVAHTFVSTGSPWLESYTWVAAGRIIFDFGFLADGISLAPALIIIALCTATAIYSIGYTSHKHAHGLYFFNYMLYAAGMLGAVLATNVIEFYFFWELMLIPSYFLIAEWGYGERRRVAFKYFIFTHFGAVSLLLGLLGIFVYTGTFSLLEAPALARQLPFLTQLMLTVLMMVGFATKMALVPLHGWLPEAHAEAPTPISVLLSGVMIEVGAYAIVRMILPMFNITWTTYEVMMITVLVAVFSMYYGGLMALAQNDIKRLLAYSSISQMGYIFFGISMATSFGLAGALFHVINHGILKGMLFMVAGIIIHQTGIRDMRKLGGLAQRMPITATAALVGALGIAGAPPTNGFMSEWLIFEGGFSATHFPNYFAFSVVAVVGSAISAAYMLWFIKRVFYGPLPEELKDVKEPPLTMLAPLVILMVAAVVLGVYPAPALNVINLGVSTLFGGG